MRVTGNVSNCLGSPIFPLIYTAPPLLFCVCPALLQPGQAEVGCRRVALEGRSSGRGRERKCSLKIHWRSFFSQHLFGHSVIHLCFPAYSHSKKTSSNLFPPTWRFTVQKIVASLQAEVHCRLPPPDCL